MAKRRTPRQAETRPVPTNRLTGGSRTQETPPDSEERLRTSVENMLDCFGIYSAIRDGSGRIVDFRVEYVNEAACADNRMTKEEQIGKGLLELLPAHRETGLFEEYCQVAETGRPLRKESLIYEGDYTGQHLVGAFDIRAAKLGDGFAAAWRDITERKRAEEALRESEELHRITLSSISDAVFLTDHTGALTYICPNVDVIFGHSFEEVRAFGNISRLLGDGLFDRDELERRREIANIEREIGDKAGNAHALLVNVKRVSIKGGTILYTCRDVTERKEAQEELRESEERYRDLYDEAPVAYFSVGIDGHILATNRRAVDLLGYALDDLVGRPALDLYPDTPEGRAKAEKLFRQFRSGQEVWEEELTMQKADGTPVWISLSVRPVRNTKGQVVASRSMAVDITERRRAEEELVRLNADLEQRVTERTAELEAEKEKLQHQIPERKRAEEKIRLLQTMTEAIGESQDFNSALGVALSKVCQTTGWDLGEAWVERPDGKALECSPAWHSSTKSLNQFRRISEEMTFPPNTGLPGRVWSSKEPEWIEDVSIAEDTFFLRARIAAKAGLKAALGVPIIADGQVLAVLAFFMLESREEDKRMVELVSAVAAQLGAVIQRKRAEEALRESEERFRLLAEHAQDIIFRYRIAEPRGYEYVSPAVTTITGYTPEDFHADPDIVSKVVYPDDRGAYQRTMADLSTDALELRWIRKDGSILWTEQRIVPIYDGTAGLVAIEGVIRDITERKRAEEALEQGREELEGKVERQMVRRNTYGLSFRELTVLHRVAAGRSDSEIAVELGISHRTVHKHVANLRAKMDVRSRTEASVRATKEGLLD